MVGSFLVAPVVARGASRPVADHPSDLLQPTFSIGRSGALKLAEAERIVDAVESTGADGHLVRYGTVGLTRHVRNGRIIERLTGNWRIPMATLVVPVEYVRDLGGESMAQVAAAGRLILGKKAAELRDAEVGDVLVLRDSRFRPREFTVGAIVDEQFVNWNEIMMSDVAASALGNVPITRVAITDIPSYQKVVSALSRKGFAPGDTWRVRRSWDLENPDGTLGLASTKELLGEFAYKPAGGSAIRVSPEWLRSSISWSHRFSGIGLRFNCNRKVAAQVQGALDEIRASGLARHIDVRNSNRYGGCYVGRYNRLGGAFGSPSRHAWGMAIDVNTVTNAQGALPTMNCSVVRIFRKWGFAWGGNFKPHDGMHFEYVGEPRDGLGYPSRFCPNKVDVPTTTLPDFSPTTTVPESSSSVVTSSTAPPDSTVVPPTPTTAPVTSNT